MTSSTNLTERIDCMAQAICGADTDLVDGINPWDSLSDAAQSRYRRMACAAIDADAESLT